MPYIKIVAPYLVYLMKNNIDAVIVVEGTMDQSYISSFYEALFVVTNGYQIPEEEIDFLNHLPKEKQILIFVDSDEAGKQIRNKLNDKLNRGINIIIDINKCNKNGKHGVAEAEKEALIDLLKPYVKEVEYGNINTSTLYQLNINKNKREYLSKEFHLGKTNNKTFLKRINYLNISEKDLINALNQYGN